MTKPRQLQIPPYLRKILKSYVLKPLFALLCLALLMKILYAQEQQAEQISLLMEQQEQILRGDSAVDEALEESLQKEEGLDIALLGKNAGLTDVVMILHFNEEKKNMSLVSIPRDLSVDEYRINSYHHREGAEVLKQKLSKITNYHIDYFVSVDMRAFVELVDFVGGVELYVPKRVDDPFFPAANKDYQRVVFEPGLQRLTGERALQYARSRKTTSDFDRSARQQLLLEALRRQFELAYADASVREKIQWIRSLLPYVETDISLLRLAELLFDFHDAPLKTGYTPSTKEEFYSLTNESGAYILLPKDKTWKSFHEKIRLYFES